MRKILLLLLENESGALSRVIGLFSQRGYNIESLNVVPTEDPTLSQITIQTVGDEKVLQQIEKQLHKLIDVLKVLVIKEKLYIEREIILIKVPHNPHKNLEIDRITKIFQGKIIQMNISSYIIQISGNTKKINAFLTVIKTITEILEISRSGTIHISQN
ncbi:acetolactate synthase small subunit [Buchnera aphidicola (Hormaphis cornu)]|nr:acetolactate synthase small subunit [Buchnera aphidicola (Hormaphis cornu)]